MSAAQNQAFQTAVVDSRKLTSKPGPSELLELYALFKVSNGEDFSKATKPGMLDLKASYLPSTHLATPHERQTNTTSRTRPSTTPGRRPLRRTSLPPRLLSRSTSSSLRSSRCPTTTTPTRSPRLSAPKRVKHHRCYE
ncbi:hypothetical protein KAF25_000043 [Fusarium avenaceum]|uniref:ACB domain-containing protein n=1 Tax=Fusarium avenaceum TaxID=40199 RepID=A0A9P7KKP3_9HYPO|nr:hypothetical protein KAF25_000043 [Fusarium avenaceum]